MNALKQCFHYDPESKPCLSLRRMLKAFDKSFIQLEELQGKEDWRGVIKLLIGTSSGKNGDVWKRYEEALAEHVGKDGGEVLPLVPSDLLHASMPAPSATDVPKKSRSKQASITIPHPTKLSPQRQMLVRALCKSYTKISANSASTEYKAQMERWCEELLTLHGCEEDVDGLVGRGEALLGKEEWEEAVKVLEKAFEAGGRSDRDVS